MPRLIPLALIAAIPLGFIAARRKARQQSLIYRLRKEARRRIVRGRLHSSHPGLLCWLRAYKGFRAKVAVK